MHFRAHERRTVRLAVGLADPRSGGERPATVIDVSLGGAGIETDEPLVPGERVAVSFATPTLWDPLVVHAVVAWSHAPKPREPGFTLGRSRFVARAGLTFDYAAPDLVLAMFEMLSTLGYE